MPDLHALKMILPPLAEQRAIAAYLDRETARLDALVAKKRRLIDLLKEQRAALISHVVTKGLPADEARAAGVPVDPPRKASGVAWLGDVPAHWGVRRLKEVARNTVQQCNGNQIPDNSVYLEHIDGWTGTTSYHDKHVSYAITGLIFLENDILFSRLRPYLCKVFRAKTHGVCVGELFVL